MSVWLRAVFRMEIPKPVETSPPLHPLGISTLLYFPISPYQTVSFPAPHPVSTLLFLRFPLEACSLLPHLSLRRASAISLMSVRRALHHLSSHPSPHPSPIASSLDITNCLSEDYEAQGGWGRHLSPDCSDGAGNLGSKLESSKVSQSRCSAVI